MDAQSLLKQVIDICRLAGDEIMKIYREGSFSVETKEGDFPVTRADKAGSRIIVEELKKISGYPIISEEGVKRKSAKRYWLVDPLDGTKEFINRNGEFTVNIGLIDSNEPVLGVVLAPTIETVYAGAKSEGSFKIEKGKKQTIKSEFKGKKPVIVTSRSHNNKLTAQFLNRLGDHKDVSMGSSLKLCLVAEGKAMLYPRYVPTYLWDTAASDAVVRSAGGEVCGLDGEPLSYDPRKAMKNPFFIVATGNSIDWRSIAT